MTRLPVLTFHAIHDLVTPVAVDGVTFGELMRRLAAAGWRTTSASNAVAFARGEKAPPERSFVIAFDDGYASVQTRAAPVLRELGFGAILFLTTSLMERPTIFPGDPLCPSEPSLTWQQARRLITAGFEIGSHACTHRDLTLLSDADLAHELTESRRVLEERLDVPVRFHAYPFGACDARVASAAARVYDGAFTTELGYVEVGNSPRLLPRLEAHYLRYLAARGDLASAGTRGYLAVRKLGRAVRSMLHGRPPAS